MKARITSHARVTSVDGPAFDQFDYSLYGDDGLFHTDTVTVRTARVFAAELEGSSAFMMLMVAIAEADPQNYAAMAGLSFDDTSTNSANHTDEKKPLQTGAVCRKS